VNNSTLTRFFSFHYLFPFIILVLVITHLVFLHEQKSSNPLGIQIACDKIPFYPYFYVKDLFSWLVVLRLFAIANLLAPFILIDPENFIPANPLSTPVHIQPE
jgi:ubiquinol-cytochrome c reductase cytochrome b subunit